MSRQDAKASAATAAAIVALVPADALALGLRSERDGSWSIMAAVPTRMRHVNVASMSVQFRFRRHSKYAVSAVSPTAPVQAFGRCRRLGPTS